MSLQEIATRSGDELTIQYVLLSELSDKFANTNPKLHDIPEIAASIKRHGFKDVIEYDAALNNGSGGIVAGNGRLEALIHLHSTKSDPPRGVKLTADGQWTIPVQFGVNSESNDESLAYLIANNNLGLSGSEFTAVDVAKLYDAEEYLALLQQLDEADALPVSVSDAELDELMELIGGVGDGGVGNGDEDVVSFVENPDENKLESRCKFGDIWQLGNHFMMCGDSTSRTDVDALTHSKKAVLLFTSPPYSTMREYKKGTDLSVTSLARVFSTWHSEFFAVNLGLKFKNSEVVPYWDEWTQYAKQCGLKMLAWNVWDKITGGSVGSATNMFMLTHEWIFVFGKERKRLNRIIPNQMDKYVKRHGEQVLSDGFTTFNRQSHGKVEGSSSCAYTHHQLHSVIQNYYFAARNPILNRHPAPFPIELPEQYILSFSDENDVIFEPFLGSGTTLMACEKTNRICYGMDLNEEYCDITLWRWEEYTGQKAKRIQSISTD